ncbi:TetR family transcriptional regulator [Pilimelia terevasa]|uniref:TetR family transcriptional regulator n=1 Tax=Pilimelia terevasa TaxID=53372 RepID=A0A8J3FLJ0_9ACTN|nr:TetR/AcrR family transcriptional regulator [Pilimelia terevasa]GGK34843.1 TetR family transcriptional regulator [Pilimelia terevasa]
MTSELGTRTAVRRSRRDEILAVAVGLFAARGYHGVSMDDIGGAAGVTGPALYHHFAGKEAMLAAALAPVSEALLAGGRQRVGAAADPAAALAALVEFHVDFALRNPAVIALHLHELDRLPEEPRREIRRLQRQYVEQWVGVLVAVRPRLRAEEARVLAHAAFGLMNSTPYHGGEVDAVGRSALLRDAALRALRGPEQV